jgi:hypothetical protein
VGRVWPRHSGGGRPLNSVVRTQPNGIGAEHQKPYTSPNLGVGRGCVGHIRGRRCIAGVVPRRTRSLVSREIDRRRLAKCMGRLGGNTRGSSVASDCASFHEPRRSLVLGASSIRRGINCPSRGVGVATIVAWQRSNNAFERTVGHRGPRLAAAQSSWPAAQLGR